MREPPDKFGCRFRELRKSKGWTSTRLSKKLGKSAGYLSDWERHTSAIPNREILSQVCEVLQLSKGERHELDRLATLRSVPAEARHFVDPSDPDANLLHALLDIEHDWPSEPSTPNPRSERAQLLIDAGAWALAELACDQTDLLPPFTHIRWPEPLRRLGIVPEVDSAVAIDPPADLIEQELPFINQLGDSVTNLDAFTQSLGMARVYRRLLFSDPKRASDAASLLDAWQYDRSQSLSKCVSLRFGRLALHEASGAQDVDAKVISSVAMRSLAHHLWTAGQTRKNRIGWWCGYESGDASALIGFLMSPEHRMNYTEGFHVRSGVYVMRSRIWPFALDAMRRQFAIEPGSQPHLDRQLKCIYIDEESREQLGKNPWLFAAVDQDVLLRYARALEGALPPPDEHVLWNPGMPYPEGHPFWKAGETELVPRDDAPASIKASVKPKAKPRSTTKATPKRKTGTKRTAAPKQKARSKSKRRPKKRKS